MLLLSALLNLFFYHGDGSSIHTVQAADRCYENYIKETYYLSTLYTNIHPTLVYMHRRAQKVIMFIAALEAFFKSSGEQVNEGLGHPSKWGSLNRTALALGFNT